ncbi:putative undecaprenyl-phosphate N-acetylglucosaminyl 1-phosphate transferase [Halomicronema hongdechloris C2206]|uniref:Undecaprenyl-phosphate N-acetylglucosaminyl 1-phosphate transferase n=1 Tax=Halomicronema hongdechloris C2206 TaxID=1641165 RepID=A0A1Z3HQF9_9CYAN|nr:glycosyltransferase family 4 protein [Halomicronema hongdechloris]ASC72554.1 putative undecaprenyl-phosphate N-acetylglucosaminyl 1-phosphate transferase [Halomicronema hongdechloris C2206]
MVILILSLISFAVSWRLVAMMRHWFRAQLLDVPNDRSSHRTPTPRGGGLGFMLAFILTSLAALARSDFPVTLPGLLQIGAVLLPLALIGFLDDWYTISARSRYGVHLLAAVLAIYSFGPFPQPWLTPWGLLGQTLAIGLTILGMTALVNFTNFMDGLDGLVASVSAVQFAFLALYLNQPVWWLLVAALVGFLRWNWSPAAIFMGDVGSTVLGGACAIALLQAPSLDLAWRALAITLPITADAIYTLCRRLWRRENIFQAHRFHLYQRLKQRGWSHGQVAATYGGLTGAIALLIYSLPGWGSLLSLGLSFAAIALGEWHLSQQQDPRTSLQG